MTLVGKTIQIYLPEGNPRGLKLAEITSRTVQALLIPRSKLDVAQKRQELQGVGVYMLFGTLETKESKPLCYIGEAENCAVRLGQHNRSKDFWTHAVVLISKTYYFTKTHIKYLEWFCYERAIKANRYILENGNTPNKPHVSEPVEADLHDNFETIQILVSTLGYPVFDEIHKPAKKDLVFCKGKLAEARGEYTEEGLIVFAGSKANLEITQSAQAWIANMRQELLEKGILTQAETTLEFVENHSFNKPSTAAMIILGRQANGWLEWKYADGRTLDEVKRNNTDEI
ncbi:MAG: GIY-YIG nuclease family protein [Deinococcota bacterium]